MKFQNSVKDSSIRDLRILYFFEWQGRGDAGVVQKVQNQIAAWKNLDVEVEIIFVTSAQNVKIDFHVPTHVFEFGSSAERLRARSNAMYFARFSRKGWIMYRRYALMTYSEIFTMAKNPTVIELNTNNDLFYRRRSAFQYLWHIVQLTFIGHLAIGACAVTDEISRQNNQRFKRISTFTNGISLNNFRDATDSQESNKLIFLAGDDFAWNGIEVLLQLATLLPKFKIDVFGINRSNVLNANIQFKEFIPSEELHEIFPEYLAGITTLQLENIGLSEAAPLKTRQYLLGGLPVIGRFSDSGLDDVFPHYFKITIEDVSNRITNHSELLRFLKKCAVREIKKSDLDSIDSEKIESKRISFLREIT